MIFIFPVLSCPHQIVWISLMGQVQALTGSSMFLLVRSHFWMWFPSQKLSPSSPPKIFWDTCVHCAEQQWWCICVSWDFWISWISPGWSPCHLGSPPVEMTWGAQAAGSYIWAGFCMYLCSNTPFSQVIPVKTPWGLCTTLWYTLYFLNILFNTHIVALFVRLGSCSLIQHFTFPLISKHINELCSETWRRTFKLLSRTAVCSFGSVSISRRAVMCSD